MPVLDFQAGDALRRDLGRFDSEWRVFTSRMGSSRTSSEGMTGLSWHPPQIPSQEVLGAPRVFPRCFKFEEL